MIVALCGLATYFTPYTGCHKLQCFILSLIMLTVIDERTPEHQRVSLSPVCSGVWNAHTPSMTFDEKTLKHHQSGMINNLSSFHSENEPRGIPRRCSTVLRPTRMLCGYIQE